MSDTREFPTAVILSIVTDRLVCEVGAMHEAAQWMAGEPVWTHQLPRVGREIAEAMIAARPELADAVVEAEQVNRDNWQEYLARWVDRYGPTMTVARLGADQHASVDPIAEARRLAPQAEVIALESTDKP